ncbi:hypothetical protein [Acetobacter papayae]|uniref:hypothetical protein n=1 Tax=Acetobacter papayae TaxID=1076592 RepID=UPI0004718784|nr:hypothetical protein [Acetobacter papayae]
MSEKLSPVEELKQRKDIGAVVDVNLLPDGPLKALYIRLLAIAYRRIYVNSNFTRPEIWQNTHVHISMDRALGAKSTSMPNWNHIIINDGLIAQLVWDAYRVGHNSEFFSGFNDEVNSQETNYSSKIDLKSISPENFLNDFASYQVENERRNSLVQALITVSFLFVIDHEYRHLAAHHEFLSSSTETPDRLTMQALELDSDTFASNRWVHMLIGTDKTLSDNETKEAITILSEQDRQITYVFFLYALFCGFRGLGQADWETTSFSFNSTHPPTSFRFKIIIAVLFDHLEANKSNSELDVLKTILPVVWPLLEFLYNQNSGPPLLNALGNANSDEANVLFEKLYKKWRDLIISKSITDWIGDFPPAYEDFAKDI